jgi:hypothetical protein
VRLCQYVLQNPLRESGELPANRHHVLGNATAPKSTTEPKVGSSNLSGRVGKAPLSGAFRSRGGVADRKYVPNMSQDGRYAEHDRGCKPSTLRDYRSNIEAHMLPAFGDQPLEAIVAAAIDRWRGSLTASIRESKDLRFGDGLDGRRQIASTATRAVKRKSMLFARARHP